MDCWLHLPVDREEEKVGSIEDVMQLTSPERSLTGSLASGVEMRLAGLVEWSGVCVETEGAVGRRQIYKDNREQLSLRWLLLEKQTNPKCLNLQSI